MNKLITSTKEITRRFMEDDSFTYAAALSFYLTLSIAPIILIFVAAIPYFNSNILGAIIESTAKLVGPLIAQILAYLFLRISEYNSILSLSMGIILAIFALSGAFEQLRYSFSKIIDPKHKKERGILNWTKRRLNSIALLSTLIVISIAVVVISSRINFPFANYLIGIVSFTIIFAFLFRYAPQKRLPWKTVWTGAAITSILFALGRYAIRYYLFNEAVTSPYGAAGSLIIILLGVYYSALIVFLGLEITKSYLR